MVVRGRKMIGAVVAIVGGERVVVGTVVVGVGHCSDQANV